MTKTPLKDYCQGWGSQRRLARAIGLTDASISNMLTAGRQVFVITHDDGRLELRETKTLATGALSA